MPLGALAATIDVLETLSSVARATLPIDGRVEERL
jgi:hypothetical protein